MYVVVVLVFSFDFTVQYTLNRLDYLYRQQQYDVQSSFFQPKVLTFNQLNRPTS